MKVLVTGGTGLIGQHLTETLEERGDEVVIVSRSRSGEGFIQWDPTDPDSLEIPADTDAVVHLAGAPVFGERWSDEYKETIRRSRVEGTRTVVEAIERSDADLRSFVSGSASGYYGDRGDEELTEGSEPGEDFLSGVCVDWEREARAIEDGPDPAVVRTGVVLSTEGGALKRMLNPFPFVWPFHWGLGGPLGDGQQYMPWIHVEDEVRAILFLIDGEHSGTFNLTAPAPARNKNYTKALGSVLNRPAFFPLPYFVLYILYGEAAGILYASQRVLPESLEEVGFEFEHRDVEAALKDLIG